MFNVNEFVNDLQISKDDEDLVRANKVVEILELICDDGYLARAAHWGMATAMENQLNFLGSRYLPSLENRLNNLKNPRGVLAESDLRVNWASNEDQPHVNEDITVEDQIAELEARVEQTYIKMRSAAIMFAVFVTAHDAQSVLLNQLSYSGIKAQAAAKRNTSERRSA